MRREIRRIAKERELTAIYVTHDRQEALSMADRLAVYKNRHSLSNKAIAADLGIRLETVARLLAADSTVRMPLATVWRLEEMIRS